jgi:hypothetical protein
VQTKVKRLGRKAYIQAFFAPPTAPQSAARLGNTLTTLYLLRREAEDCFINGRADTFKFVSEQAVIERPRRYRLFATSMVLMAGIDLLAKFAAGDDSTGRDGQRFTNYLMTYAGLRQPEADALYRIRCALLHSFGLFDRGKKDQQTKRLVRLKLALTDTCSRQGGRCTGLSKVSGQWQLCVRHLYQLFIQSVANYRGALDPSMDLKKKFTMMFHQYGYLSVYV